EVSAISVHVEERTAADSAACVGHSIELRAGERQRAVRVRAIGEEVGETVKQTKTSAIGVDTEDSAFSDAVVAAAIVGHAIEFRARERQRAIRRCAVVGTADKAVKHREAGAIGVHAEECASIVAATLEG